MFAFAAIFVVALLAIFGYGKFRCKNPTYVDPLQKHLGILDLDGWSVAHFALFAFVGATHPKLFVPSMLLGIAWEGFEHYLGDKRPGWLGGYGDCEMSEERKKDTQGWWYGRLSDIGVNALGFAAGYYWQM